MEVIMTREDVLKLFPEATDEQITNLLNQNNSEVARERGKADKYKSDAQKTAELQAELDRLNEQNLSDIEKANKATETANSRVADLEKQIKAMQTKASLAEIGIVGEQADKLFADGNLDFSILGQIISDRETKAASAEAQKLLDNTPNPGGSTGGNPGEEVSKGAEMAKKYNQNNVITV